MNKKTTTPISNDALDEWKRVILVPLDSIYKGTVALCLFMTIIYKPTEAIPHMKYFEHYTLYPALLLGLVIALFRIFFNRLAPKLTQQTVAIIIVLLTNVYVAVNLFAFRHYQFMITAVFFPVILAPIYKEKSLLYLQVGISTTLLLAFTCYTQLGTVTVPQNLPFTNILVVMLLFYSMVKLELEVVTSANMLDLAGSRDSLTRLFNHEKFYEVLEEHMAQFTETQLPFSVIIADIDNFKKVNDTYGHAFGDEVIKRLAQTMLQCKGSRDICARYGGEEFTVILPNKTLDQAILEAEHIRTAFQASTFVANDGTEHHFSISLGVAEYHQEYSTASSFFELADKALYEAKESGKNRVCCSR